MQTIQDGKEVLDMNNISDGYHTFGELYKHRHHLFIALCNSYRYLSEINNESKKLSYKSKKHFDGSEWDGWFIVQLETEYGQISYHLPIEYWNNLPYMKELEFANKWDGHTSDDVLERLLKI